MMNLLRKARPFETGYNVIMDRKSFPLKYLKMGRIILDESVGGAIKNVPMMTRSP